MTETVQALLSEQIDTGFSASVAEMSKQHNTLFLHGISHSSWVQSNSLLMAEHADFQTKLEVCLAFSPHVSASTLASAKPERLIAYQSGLIVADGTITEVHKSDAGTVALGLHHRSQLGRLCGESTTIAGQIEKVVSSDDNFYSEIAIKNPKFAGLYWRSSQERSPRTTVPEYLVNASKRFELPLYIVGDGGARIVSALSEDGTYMLGDAVSAQDMKPATVILDIDQKQQELLEKGVFRVAGRERALVAASENGRLAYYAEQLDLSRAVTGTDNVATHITGLTGLSMAATITVQNEIPSIESARYGVGGSIKPIIHRYYDTQDLNRHVYTIRPPWIGNQALEKYGLDDFEALNSKEGDYLSIIEQYICGVKDVIKQYGIDPDITLYGGRQQLQNYFVELGFFLYGFASEAAKQRDTNQADRARSMAAELVHESYYAETLERRTAKRIGTFILTREDLDTP